MFYLVECSYRDPQSEAAWNTFYTQQKLPALISVTGFITSQRFRALQPGCPAYLAIHTLTDAAVLDSEAYRLKGGGNFATWQGAITDWQRSLYNVPGAAPAINADEILILGAQPVSLPDPGAENRWLEMRPAGATLGQPSRFACVLPADSALQLKNQPGICLYIPLTPQLQSAA